MKSHKCTLMDTIECSWWDNDGPVHMRAPVKPFEEELRVITAALNTLQAEGKVERIQVGKSNNGKWRLRIAQNEEAEAAE